MDDPTDAEQIAFIIEELLDKFNEAQAEGAEDMVLKSAVGGRFHKRVLQAAKSLDLTF